MKNLKYAVIDHHSIWGWPKQETTTEDANIIFVWNDFTIEEHVKRWQKQGKKVICFEHGWNALFDYELNKRKCLADLYITLGSSSAASLIRYGLPKEKVLVTGNPHFDILFKKELKQVNNLIPKILYTALHWTRDMSSYNDMKLNEIIKIFSPYADISVKNNSKTKINVPGGVGVWYSQIEDNKNLFNDIIEGLSNYDIILTPKESTFDFLALKMGKRVFRIGYPSEYHTGDDQNTRAILPISNISTNLLFEQNRIDVDLEKEVIPSIDLEDILQYVQS